MCLTTYLEAKCETMGPGEQLTIDRDWIQWLLSEHRCGCAAPSTEPTSLLGYNTSELAAKFHVSPSTIKVWCAAGVFGDACALKPTGRDWFVPEANVERVLQQLAMGWRITQDGLVRPESSNAGVRPDSSPAPAKSPAADTPSARKAPPPGGSRSRGRARRHNAWRERFSEASGNTA